MKKILYPILVFIIILTSCRKPDPPVADFAVDSGSLVVGQELYFENNSSNAVSFEWDFGDGYGSDEVNPYHIFNSNGTYEVFLTAIDEDGRESTASMVLEIKIPTLLVIDVVEWSDDPNEYNLIPDAEVRIYESLLDWDDANDNWILLGVTDDNGSTVFSNLGPYVYYVDAFKGYNVPNGYDNYTLRNEDVYFITTPTIIPNYINYFVAWVDPADHTGAKGTRSREMVIKKIERRVMDENHPRNIDSMDWKELYERSIKK